MHVYYRNNQSAKRSWRGLLLPLLAAATAIPLHIGSGPAFALETTKENLVLDVQSSTVSYDPQYFVEYNPITVMDMLRRIPSANSVLASSGRRGGGRGFGSDGAPILIDGKRISGKSIGTRTRLGQILASQVERIDLIRGTSSGLDVRSDGLIINIILVEGSGQSHTSWSVKAEKTQGMPMGVEGRLSHNGSSKNLEYNFSLDRSLYSNFEKKNNNKSDSSGLLYENEYETNLHKAKEYKATTSLKYTLSNGDILHLNGLYSNGDSTSEERKNFSDIDVMGISSFDETIYQEVSAGETEWEIGGDYVGDIDALGQLKVLFIINQEHELSDTDRTEINESASSLLTHEYNDSMEREKILRASVTRAFGPKHEIEYGIEGALNSLDNVFDFVDAQDADDNVIETIDVSEKRFEGFASHSYNPSPKVTLLSSLNSEYSKISQKGPAGKSRKFFFLKPRFDFRYELNSESQIRAVVERTVSQLNFREFAISYNSTDDEFELGNPDLAPEKAWRNSLTYEHRLPNDGGSFEMQAFYNMINDHIDKITIVAGKQTTGNIGDATEYGLRVKSSFRLVSLGLSDAILSANATMQGSNTTDPFTGNTRPMKWHGPSSWRLNFEHDVSKANLSYGIELRKDPSGQRSDIDDQMTISSPAKLNAFMELATFGDMKLRLDARNILRSRRNLTRTLFAGDITDNNIEWVKEQDRTLSRKIMLSLRGLF